MSRKHHTRKRDRLLIRKRMEAPPTYSEVLPEPELQPEIASVEVRTLTIDTITAQLSSIKDNARSMAAGDDPDEIWEMDVKACEAAIAILQALQDEGIGDTEALKDLIFDYTLANKQLKTMTEKYERPTAPEKISGNEICPDCSAIIHRNWWKHCPDCGRRIRR